SVPGSVVPPPAEPPLAAEVGTEKLVLTDLAPRVLSEGELRTISTAAIQHSQPFGPTHFETNCGFKLQGSCFVSAFSRSGHSQVGIQKDIVVVAPFAGQPISVLLEFDDGRCTVLPAIPDFIASLTITDSE